MNNSLEFVYDLLTELRTRVPPKDGTRHNITLTYDERLELTVWAPDIQQVFYLDPTEDGDLSPTDIVDFVVETLNKLRE